MSSLKSKMNIKWGATAASTQRKAQHLETIAFAGHGDALGGAHSIAYAATANSVAVGRVSGAVVSTSPVRRFVVAAVTEPASGIQLSAKRAFDFVCSLVVLLLLLPVLLLIALLIKAESQGPALFVQTRTGLNGRNFKILKFRSMRIDNCDATGVNQTVAGDPRMTRIGRILRKTNLDELPQFWNVLVGDMSLVGPRPHVPDMLAAGVPYHELVDGYEYRHMMRPGLTGLAQARGLRGPTNDRWKSVRRVICDVEYVRNFSLALDAKIILRTIITEFRGGTGF